MHLRLLATAAVLLVGAIAWSGCVGFSRQESKELSPADSVSRAIAEATPVDTMRLVWRLDSLSGEEDSDWQYLSSVRFGTDSLLLASDLGRALIYSFDESGRHFGSARLDPGSFPYLLYATVDSTVVFEAGTGQVRWLSGTKVIDTLKVAVDTGTERDALGAFAAYAPGRLVLKTLEPSLGARLEAYRNPHDARSILADLTGTAWRYRGPVRIAGDSVISTSAFLPLLHVWTPAGLDTMRLHGFDSPVLNKTRLFMSGERDDPPLLVASLAVQGPYLFVLNVRPGWVRVDVYDRSGRLQRILVEPEAQVSDFNVQDIAVRSHADGTYQIAVASVAAQYGLASLTYRPRLAVYSWDAGP